MNHDDYVFDKVNSRLIFMIHDDYVFDNTLGEEKVNSRLAAYQDHTGKRLQVGNLNYQPVSKRICVLIST